VLLGLARLGGSIFWPLLALASSGHRDGSLIRMKRIFLINRILLKL
jgi:hypothetical protein